MGVDADRLKLFELVSAYAACLDGGDPSRFAGLFLPDGRLTAKLPDGGESVRVGTHELMTNVRAFHVPGPFLQTLHVIGNHLVEVEGDTARGYVHCVAHHLVEREGAHYDEVQVLRYDDAYARTENGWRFASRWISCYWETLVPVDRPHIAQARRDGERPSPLA